MSHRIPLNQTWSHLPYLALDKSSGRVHACAPAQRCGNAWEPIDAALSPEEVAVWAAELTRLSKTTARYCSVPGVADFSQAYSSLNAGHNKLAAPERAPELFAAFAAYADARVFWAHHTDGKQALEAKRHQQTQEALTKTQNELKQARAALAAADAERAQAREELKAERTALNKAGAERNAARAELKSAQEELKTARAELTTARAEHSLTKCELVSAMVEIGALQSAIAAAGKAEPAGDGDAVALALSPSAAGDGAAAAAAADPERALTPIVFEDVSAAVSD